MRSLRENSNLLRNQLRSCLFRKVSRGTLLTSLSFHALCYDLWKSQLAKNGILEKRKLEKTFFMNALLSRTTESASLQSPSEACEQFRKSALRSSLDLTEKLNWAHPIPWNNSRLSEQTYQGDSEQGILHTVRQKL